MPVTLFFSFGLILPEKLTQVENCYANAAQDMRAEQTNWAA